MTYKVRSSLVDFVEKGGGYVGFCAGAYMATSRIGRTRYAGLGIFPGGTSPYGTGVIRPDLDYSLQNLTWQGVSRLVFYEGGPFLYGLNPAADHSETLALYDSGFVAAARAIFGKGRVVVSGPHPEAPAIWTEEDGIHDPDGEDIDLAIDMVRWAAHL